MRQLLVFTIIGIGIGFFGTTLYNQVFSYSRLEGNSSYVPQTLATKPSVENTTVDSDFLRASIDQYIREGKTFIVADLTAMSLDVYVNGSVDLRVPIQAKGREGSWWETPSGVYTIQAKSENHLSSIGNVYMPWSMQFQGNFFVHGLPYYPDGTPVSTDYSGGCIRLATADAETVFRRTPSGTPIIVIENNTSSPHEYAMSPSKVQAPNFMAADLKSGYVFASKGIHTLLDVTLAERLLTSVIAAEYMDIERWITFDASDAQNEPSTPLEPGTRYRVYDYLYLLLQEGSVAGQSALSRGMGGNERTLALLQKKASSIGMNASVFSFEQEDTASRITTMQDLYQLVRYMHFNRNFLLNISANTASTRVYGAPVISTQSNTNIFVGDPLFLGGAVQMRNAGAGSGIFIFNISFENELHPVVITVYDSPDLRSDVLHIRQFIENSFIK